MKSVLSVFFLFVSLSAMSCDFYAAQVSMKVVGVKTDSMTECKALVDYDSIEVFNPHLFCPLSEQAVIANGVDFPLENGHDCEVPEVISGVIVKKNGKIFRD